LRQCGIRAKVNILGLKAFAKQWIVWVKGTGTLDKENDEIPVISSDMPLEL
jgi:hypothetical protein